MLLHTFVPLNTLCILLHPLYQNKAKNMVTNMAMDKVVKCCEWLQILQVQLSLTRMLKKNLIVILVSCTLAFMSSIPIQFSMGGGVTSIQFLRGYPHLVLMGGYPFLTCPGTHCRDCMGYPHQEWMGYPLSGLDGVHGTR